MKSASSEKYGSRLRMLMICAIMTAVLCILGPMTIPIGPIPISLSILIICLDGYLLGAKYAALSVGLYLLLGFVGLPVFAGYTAGLGKLVGPTGGFIIGYLFTAAISGFAAEKSDRNLIPTALGMAIGVLTAYVFGTIWFIISAHADLVYALSVCVIPFIPLDILKIVLAMIIGKAVRRAASGAGIILK